MSDRLETLCKSNGLIFDRVRPWFDEHSITSDLMFALLPYSVVDGLIRESGQLAVVHAYILRDLHKKHAARLRGEIAGPKTNLSDACDLHKAQPALESWLLDTGLAHSHLLLALKTNGFDTIASLVNFYQEVRRECDWASVPPTVLEALGSLANLERERKPAGNSSVGAPPSSTLEAEQEPTCEAILVPIGMAVPENPRKRKLDADRLSDDNVGRANSNAVDILQEKDQQRQYQRARQMNPHRIFMCGFCHEPYHVACDCKKKRSCEGATSCLSFSCISNAAKKQFLHQLRASIKRLDVRFATCSPRDRKYNVRLNTC
jgi:hypothetical protein